MHPIRRMLYRRSFFRPRIWRIEFQAVVRNKGARFARAVLLFPMPQAGPTQEMLERPRFNTACEVKSDLVYGNEYALVKLDLAPGQETSILQQALVRVFPRKAHFSDSANSRTAQLGQKNDLYLVANAYITSNDVQIRSLAKQIVGQDHSATNMLRRVNEYVVRKLRYGLPIAGLYSAGDALTLPLVDCGGFDTLEAALLQSLGYPVRIVSGFWATGKHDNAMHAWLEVRLPDGQWVGLDPSVEHLQRAGKSARFLGFGQVGADRIITGYGCAIPVSGLADRIPILQNPMVINGPIDDLEISVFFKTPTYP